MSAAPTLHVENLRAYFRTRGGPARAVDGVSFDLFPGETFALVGESGCGKSVTALSILQLLPPATGYLAGGRVLLEGEPISGLSPAAMRAIRGNDISMIFQEPMTALNPVFTIGRQIVEVLELHRGLRGRDAREEAAAALDEVGIPSPRERLHEYPHQLSGGMRQRVMIAMALACRPKILIADEPTTALDVTIQAQILALIDSLRRERGTAVLLITHDMGVVREHADRIGVMYGGRLVETASTEAVFGHPAHPYTELLMRALPTRTQRGRKLATIPGMVPQATEEIRGCRFHNRCPVCMDVCPETPVAVCEIAPGHHVACHLFGSEASDRATLPDQRDAIPGATSRSDSGTCLSLDDLKTYFPVRKGLFRRVARHKKAVDGVTLDLRRGETLALVGESGCGKTTVGKTIIRLLDPHDGTVLFDGQDLAPLSRKEMKPVRRRIQFVFQDPFSSLNPRMMIGDALVECMATHGIGARRAERLERSRALLERVGLAGGMVSRYPHEFSGGQRQRVALARALAPEPDLLICDEATSALDVSVQAQILNLLKDLQADLELTYLFITHDLGVVEYLADRVAVMYLGRIVEEGMCEEIFEAAKHPYTQALLASIPRPEESADRPPVVLKGDVPSLDAPPSGCHFHPRCPHALPVCSQTYPDSASFSTAHSCRCHLHVDGGADGQALTVSPGNEDTP